MITRFDKGSSEVILDESFNKDKILKVIEDVNIFKITK